MPRCLYWNCKNNTNNVGKIISFHRLPTNECDRGIWLAKIGLPECTFKFGLVCSVHFRETDLLRINGKNYLRKDVTPVQFIQEPQLCGNYKNVVSSSHIDVDNHMISEDQLCDNYEHFVDLSTIDVDHINDENVQEVLITNGSIKSRHNEHNYCQTAKRISAKVVAQSYAHRRQVSKLRQTVYQLHREIKSLKKSASKKMEKFKNFPELPPFLQELIEAIIKHYKKGSRPKKYSPEFRQFALTLHYYSPTAYDYVRNELLSCLPCDKTIRSWYRTVDGKPGFSDTALLALQTLQQNTPYKIVGCLSVDGMHLRKHLQSNGNSTIGYVDFGGVIETDKRTMANEALNFMFVGMNIPVKLPLGYFLINGIGAVQLASLTTFAIELVYDSGVITATVTYDGLSSNFASSKVLGCDWSDPFNIKTELRHNGPFKTFAWPDMPHMIKLWRNTFHDFGGFLDGSDSNKKIEWKYIARLFDLQNNMKKVHMGNKLRKLHVNYKNQIMKVYLATQLFSNSVADAIETCENSFNLPDFRGSGTTVKFIRIMNDLFDIFNSIDMKSSSYKQPLHKANYNFVMNRINEIEIFILELTEFDGTPMYQSSRNTSVIGVLMLIVSLREFYKEYIEEQRQLSYIATYKANQDNLEIFNGTMRSHSGYNSNPTCIQYVSGFKKALVHGQLNTKRTGNCIPLEDIHILHENAKLHPPPSIENFIADIDNSEDELDGILSNVLIERCTLHHHLDVYVNIIAYISGFVARRISSSIKCADCKASLITEDENDSEFMIIHGKRRGELFFPSRSVREICSVADKTFSHALKVSGGNMLNVEYTIERMVLVVGHFCMENTTLFEELENHFRKYPTELHFYILVKSIATLYLKIRVHYLNKTLSGNNGTRQKKRHETHFLGL